MLLVNSVGIMIFVHICPPLCAMCLLCNYIFAVITMLLGLVVQVYFVGSSWLVWISIGFGCCLRCCRLCLCLAVAVCCLIV